MDKDNIMREAYVTPEMEISELREEAILCASLDQNGFGFDDYGNFA